MLFKIKAPLWPICYAERSRFNVDGQRGGGVGAVAAAVCHHQQHAACDGADSVGGVDVCIWASDDAGGLAAEECICSTSATEGPAVRAGRAIAGGAGCINGHRSIDAGCHSHVDWPVGCCCGQRKPVI